MKARTVRTRLGGGRERPLASHAPRLLRIPRYFVENLGQFPESVRYFSERDGVIAALTARGISLAARERVDSTSFVWRLAAFEFVEADRVAEPSGAQPLPSTSSFFRGAESQWVAGARNFAAVAYPNVADGVDLVILERDGHLAYDVHLDAGANLDSIEIAAHCATAMSIEPDGALAFETDLGRIRHSAPLAWYEESDGSRTPAGCSFDLRGEHRFGFRLDEARRRLPLVIDPGITWSTYFGGSQDEEIRAIDVDSGLVTIAGSTTSSPPSFPVFPMTAPPNLQVTLAGQTDAFVARLDPAQTGSSQLVWASYLGGSDNDIAHDVVVQSNGHFAVVGETTNGASTPFPVTSATAIQSAHPLGTGGVSGFVTFVTVNSGPTLGLGFSTYYGNTVKNTYAYAVDLNDGGNITFGGSVGSSGLAGDIPLPPPSSPTQPWDPVADDQVNEGFFARVDRGDPFAMPPTPASVLYATYLSRSGNGTGLGMVGQVTSIRYRGGRVYVAGWTDSPDMDHPAGAFRRYNATLISPQFDGFLMKFNPATTPNQQLEYGTFIGGDVGLSSGGVTRYPDDRVFDIDVAQGAVYLCGRTSSADFPVTTYTSQDVEAPGYFHQVPTHATDYGFVVKLIPAWDPTNSQLDLRYGTYLGGSAVDWATSIARVGSQSIVVTGFTDSDGSSGTAFPTTDGTGGTGFFDTTFNGTRDAFVTYLKWGTSPPPVGHPVASQLRLSTFLGSGDTDQGWAIAVDGFEVYVGGFARGADFPAVNPFDVSLGGSQDGFIAAFSLPTTN